MNRNELHPIIEEVTRRLTLPMENVESVIREYVDLITNRLDLTVEPPSPITLGAFTYDTHATFRPGILMIYSMTDMGKTSLAKLIASTGVAQGLNVLYIDAEHKMYLHDKARLGNVVFADIENWQAIMMLLESRVIDMILVDTITSVNHSRVRAFLTNIRKYVPYIVLVAQMRQNTMGPGMIPACSDTVLSSAHTHICLTSGEQITREGYSLRLVQYAITKYEPDLSISGIRDSFVIRDHIVDNLYSAFHVLQSRGRIRAKGNQKFLDGEPMLQYRQIAESPALQQMIFSKAWEECTNKPLETEIYAKRMQLGMPCEDSEGDGTGESAIPGGVENTLSD